MGARRAINRYREEPSGYDYKDVLRRGKRWHTHGDTHNDFEMQPFYSGTTVLWTAGYPTLPTFSRPHGTITVKWDGKKWKEYTGEEEKCDDESSV